LSSSAPVFWLASVKLPTAMYPPSAVCRIWLMSLPAKPAWYARAQVSLPAASSFWSATATAMVF